MDQPPCRNHRASLTEETRRRVSVDFTLTEQQRKGLAVSEGVIVPISVLTKEPRRNFDLRDEGGAAIPVLGRQENGELVHVAVLQAAVEALNGNVTEEAFVLLQEELAEIVLSPREDASEASRLLHRCGGIGRCVAVSNLGKRSVQKLAGNPVGKLRALRSPSNWNAPSSHPQVQLWR